MRNSGSAKQFGAILSQFSDAPTRHLHSARRPAAVDGISKHRIRGQRISTIHPNPPDAPAQRRRRVPDPGAAPRGVGGALRPGERSEILCRLQEQDDVGVLFE